MIDGVCGNRHWKSGERRGTAELIHSRSLHRNGKMEMRNAVSASHCKHFPCFCEIRTFHLTMESSPKILYNIHNPFSWCFVVDACSSWFSFRLMVRMSTWPTMIWFSQCIWIDPNARFNTHNSNGFYYLFCVGEWELLCSWLRCTEHTFLVNA